MASYKKNTRMCIACRQHSDKSELVRFARSYDGVILDEKQDLPGRGVWLHPRRECVEKAKKKKLLSAQFHENVPTEILGALDDR